MANDPLQGPDARTTFNIYKGLEDSLRQLNREIGRGASSAGAAADAADKARRDFEDAAREVSRRRPAAGPVTGATSGTPGGAVPPAPAGSILAGNKQYQEGLERQNSLIATQADQAKKLNRAQQDLSKTQQNLHGLRLAQNTADSTRRKALAEEIRTVEEAQARQASRVSDRAAVLRATQQRLALEQAVLITMQQQLATMQAISATRHLPAPGAPGGALAPVTRSPISQVRAAIGPGAPWWLNQNFPQMTRPTRLQLPAPTPPPRLGTPYTLGAGGGGGVWLSGPPVGDRWRSPLQLPQWTESTIAERNAQRRAPSSSWPPPAERPRVLIPPAPTAATSDFQSSLRGNAAAFRGVGSEMRRYGALTTEFIDATRRGAVSIRELGWELTSTAGKFGGWLAAGGLIYGGIGAVGQIATGAIESQSGVKQLGRVVDDLDEGGASRRFRDLASEYNVPVDVAADAAFEMGKAFRDQESALEGTQAILSAVKVGEMDMATASRYLTSIVHGFNLEATDMNVVMDQINEAQNRFGVRINDTVAGLAKSSGVMRAAQTDASTTLALIGTIARVTGQSGEPVGTALARAPNFLRRPSNQMLLRDEFGIDPTAPFGEIIEQAFDAVERQRLGGQDLQRLAAGIFGPLYGARSGTPLLQNEELYRRFQAETSPQAAEGSAARELASVLSEARQELAEVGVNLQRIGSVLVDIGAFDFLGVSLKTANELLKVVTDVLEVFNSLPDPVRDVAVYFGEAVAAVAILRRLNLGPMLAEGHDGSGFRGAAATLFTRRNQEQFRLTESLVQDDAILREEEGRAARRAVRASLDQEMYEARAVENRAALQAVDEQIGQLGQVEPGDSRLEELTREREKVVTQLNDSEERLRSAVIRETDELDRAAAAGAARERGLAIRNVLDDPNLTEEQRRRLARMERLVPANLDAGDLDAAAKADAELAARVKAQEEEVRRGLDAVVIERERAEPEDNGRRSGRVRNEATRVNRRIGNMRRAIAETSFFGRSFGREQDAIVPASQRMSNALSRIRLGRLGAVWQGLGQGMRAFGQGLLALINPLTLAIAGITVIGMGISRINAKKQEFEEAVSQIPTDQASYDQSQQRLSDIGQSGQSILDLLTGGEKRAQQAWETGLMQAEVRNQQVQDFIRAQGEVYESAEASRKKAEAEAQRIAREGEDVGLLRSIAGRVLSFGGSSSGVGGLPDSLGLRGVARNISGQRTSEEIQRLADDLFKQRRGNFITEEIASKSIQTLNKAEREAIGTIEERRAAVENTVKALRGAVNIPDERRGELILAARLSVVQGRGLINRMDQLAEIAGEALADQIDMMAGAVSSGLGSPAMRQNLNAMVLAQAGTLIQAGEPEGLAQAREAIDAQVGAVETAARRELDFGLAFAKSQEDRDKAWDAYFRSISPQREGRGAIRNVANDRKRLLTLQQERRTLERTRGEEVVQGLPGLLLGSLGGDPAKALKDYADSLTSSEKNIRQNRREMRTIRDRLAGSGKALAEQVRAFAALKIESLREEFQDDVARLEAQSEYRQSQMPEGAPRLREALRSVRQQISGAIGLYARDGQEMMDLLTEEQNLIVSLIDEQFSMLQANQRYDAARFIGQESRVPELQNTLSDAQERLAFMRRNPAAFSAVDIRNAEAEIQETRFQIQEALREEAEKAEEEAKALAEARGDTRLARIERRGDEVAIARERRRQAGRRLRDAETPLEREEARAAYIRTGTDLQTAIFNTQIEDIQSQADIGKLTLQQQISRYREILKTAQLTRDQRRDLRRRIHGLEEEAKREAGSFDLSVGNIRLPTVYEIRRAMRGVRGGGGQQVTLVQHNSYSYTATGPNANEMLDRTRRDQEQTARRAHSMNRSAGVV